MLSCHAELRSQVVPAPAAPGQPGDKTDKPAGKSRYIPWAVLLRRTCGIEIVCAKCQAPLHLIALIKTEHIAKKILTAMRLPTHIPELHPARPPPGQPRHGDDRVN